MGAPANDDGFEVLVAGAGPVGACLACALAGAGLRTAIFDGGASVAGPAGDDRPIALSYGSRLILEGLDLWAPLETHATPIRHVHVSDRGRFGTTRIAARDFHVDALGYVIGAGALGRVLERRLAECDALELLRPAQVDGVRVAAASVEIALGLAAGDRRAPRARLLVVADGGRSRLREQLGIGASVRDYAQVAVTSRVRPARTHDNVAYERFTEDGPLAMLPMADATCGVVWTMAPQTADRVMGLDDAAFAASLQDCFGTRLGRLDQPAPRHRFPLHLVSADVQTAERAVVIGNASRVLHPVAGQGLNLGLRDAATLAEVVIDAIREGTDPGARESLDRYARWRAPDQRRVTRFTDGLVRVFSNRLGPVALGRGLGMLAIDVLPPLKRYLGERAMGRAGRQPRLARGLPL